MFKKKKGRKKSEAQPRFPCQNKNDKPNEPNQIYDLHTVHSEILPQSCSGSSYRCQWQMPEKKACTTNVRHKYTLMTRLTLMLTFADGMLFSGRYGAEHGFVFYVWGVKNHRNIRFVVTQTGISKMNL